MCDFRKDILIRRLTGQYVDGKWIDNAPSEFTIKGSLQPLNGIELRLLPENRREVASYRIYTDTELFTGAKGSSQSPDRAVLSDGQYEVVRVEPWQNGLVSHYKIFISKLVSND
jgi:hypothetical protein